MKKFLAMALIAGLIGFTTGCPAGDSPTKTKTSGSAAGKKDESKKDDSKMKDESKKDEPKKDESKKDEPKKDESKTPATKK